MSARPENLHPLPGSTSPGGFSFAASVQPVLDRYCISCHGLNSTEGNLDLTGTLTGYFNNSYEQLVSREGLVSLAKRKQETSASEPQDYGAHAGRLASFLLNEHGEYVTLPASAFEILAAWLDINAPYYGDYRFVKPERRKLSGAMVEELKAHLKSLNYGPFGDIDNTPTAALINTASPVDSRALNLPLSTNAGGWSENNWLWSTRDDPGYLKTLSLITNIIEKSPVIPLRKSMNDAFVY